MKLRYLWNCAQIVSIETSNENIFIWFIREWERERNKSLRTICEASEKKKEYQGKAIVNVRGRKEKNCEKLTKTLLSSSSKWLDCAGGFCETFVNIFHRAIHCWRKEDLDKSQECVKKRVTIQNRSASKCECVWGHKKMFSFSLSVADSVFLMSW